MSKTGKSDPNKLIPVSVRGEREIPGCKVNLVRCTRCGIPETYETAEFDEFGVCSICLQNDFKIAEIDWSRRKSELDLIIEKYRGKSNYDAIVPFSGGKDSTFTLLYLMKEYQIRPLVVQFDHGFMRPNLIENNEKIVFIYYNGYTNDFNDIIDFYNTFSYNKNIYIVGIFQNNYEKKMLYENINCKIYQNYDVSIIFNEIKSAF